MFRNKDRVTGRKKIYIVFVVSLLLGLVASFCLHFFAFHPAVTTNPNMIITLFLLALPATSLILAALFLAGLHRARLQSQRECSMELSNFKTFINDIQKVPSEIEAIEVLYNFINKIYIRGKIKMFYRTDSSLENSRWKTIAEANPPKCSILCDNCPMINSKLAILETSCESANDVCCTPAQCKGGKRICISMADKNCPFGVLHLCSLDGGLFTDSPEIIKIMSYIDLAVPMIKSKKTLSILSKKASTDKLTKLYNRNFLEPYLENQIEAANLSGQQLSLMILDLDHYKNINDSLGHSAGDHVLAHFSTLMTKCIRKSDIAARFGGDEFIIVLPSTGTETAVKIAEKIRLTFSTSHIPPHDGADIPPVSCSIGISTFPVHCKCRDDLFKTADTALYKAKEDGRDRVRVYGE